MDRGLKYGNHKTEYNGRVFDSKKEAKRAQELELLQKGGVIKDLRYQPRYMLQPPFKREGKAIRAIEYVADFEFWDCELKKTITEDVKGFATAEFKLKEKMFRYHYPNRELRVLR